MISIQIALMDVQALVNKNSDGLAPTLTHYLAQDAEELVETEFYKNYMVKSAMMQIPTTMMAAVVFVRLKKDTTALIGITKNQDVSSFELSLSPSLEP